MKCKICNNQAERLFTAKVLNKYEVAYYQCGSCSFIQTEKVFWLEEAYESAINTNDTGIMARNERFRRIVTVLLRFCFDTRSRYLDYAGGYGIFTRMMRDVGFDYYWDDVYAKNLVSIGFEHRPGAVYKAITAFEVFEHLDDPFEKIGDMLRYSDTIIFSTELVPDTTPSESWWYYAFSHGQHIAFYHRKTLEYIAAKYGLSVVSNGSNLHMFTRKRLPGLIFKALCKGSKYGLYPLAKIGMRSRTYSDHKLMS